ncbi:MULTISPECIES: FKBP-type peptidyl-prolyl cis-trans isomerase N-terminal domain-containing protein [Enterobacter]|uniref:FKBP-type peptidyl-prolyl cis-trans isomerase N-terminal domain-containing protein n=1 Tax=Enterobacter TaxID=547 RepID=UPI0013F4E687|nr:MULTISPECIES: FKBP-type peptidyl-prolyl cis-trans isomerase N-terminal domain-containing protein [Enterobacter]MBS0865794.1 FKBP-type peptidyl-prolyl cis-trans isomerase N-terminal domain-containing protein [Enterobacter mori]
MFVLTISLTEYSQADITPEISVANSNNQKINHNEPTGLTKMLFGLSENNRSSFGEDSQNDIPALSIGNEHTASLTKDDAKMKAAPILPKTTAEKMAYVAGQSMASGVREGLLTWNQAGMNISRDMVITGLNDGLNGEMKLSRDEMDAIWNTFSENLQHLLEKKMHDGEAIIARQIAGQKPEQIKDGIAYIVKSKGDVSAGKRWPRQVEVTEKLVDGTVISQPLKLEILPSDSLPPVLQEALPLLGKGGEVVAWGLAKSVYGELALPASVTPFTVLEYKIVSLEEN